MYTNPYCVRQLTKLLEQSDILDKKILANIKKAESIINPMIASRYMIPIEKRQNLTGTISTVVNNERITGIGTLFTQEVKAMDMIRVNSSGEALRVDRIESDTSLIVEYEEVTNAEESTVYSGKPLYNSTDSSFIVIPSELSTATEYEAARLILLNTTADRSRNRENGKYSFLDEYEIIAKPIIDNLKEGLYYDSSLKSQLAQNSTGRNVEVFQTETTNNTVSFIEEIEDLFKMT